MKFWSRTIVSGVVSVAFGCSPVDETASSGAGGGGGGSDGGSGGSGGSPAEMLEKAIARAAKTADSDPSCGVLAGQGNPTGFYWELGDAAGALASGSVGSFTRDTKQPVGSACKMVSAAYFLEKIPDLTEEARARLRFVSGYTAKPTTCPPGASVSGCFDAMGGEAGLDPAAVGHYFYGPAHMQKLGLDLGLGDLDTSGLAAEVFGALGVESPDVGFRFASFAGGAELSPAAFAEVLRGIVSGKHRLREMLGKDEVCTTECGYETYTPSSEPWRYSYGHWVEDACGEGSCDGAFSTLGAAGFYAWIDASARHYGIVGHFSPPLAGQPVFMDSAYCGQAIRAAFLDELHASPSRCGETALACAAGEVCCSTGCAPECP